MSAEFDVMQRANESIIGASFDDEIQSSERVKFNPGLGLGMHRRETWQCEGIISTYFIKYFQDGDRGWDPEAAFFDYYADQLDHVANGNTQRDLDAGYYSKALATRMIIGENLGGLLQSEADTDERQNLTNIGVGALRRLHAIPTDGFGVLNEDGTSTFTNWGEYIDAMLDYIDTNRHLMLEGGLSEDEFSESYDRIQQSREDEVASVLCFGDPKPVHVVVDSENQGHLLDFGRVQAKIPLRDVLQYGTFDRVYFDIDTLYRGLMEGDTNTITTLEAEHLIKMAGLLIYSARNGDDHANTMSNMMRNTLADTSPDVIQRYSSVEGFLPPIE